MKQNTSISSPTVGTSEDTMMICVVLRCCGVSGLSVVTAEGENVVEKGLPIVVAEVEVTLDPGNKLVGPINFPFTDNGTTGDGGKEAIHFSYPIRDLRDEYLSSKNTL